MRRAAALAATLAVTLAGLCLPAGVRGETAPAERRSDSMLLGPETRAMQADDTANPGMLAVAEGEELWGAPAGRACAGCHGDARLTMRGVAARFPAWREDEGVIDLAGQVNRCRRLRQDQPPLARESPELLALTAFVAHQSRGLPIAPPDDEPVRAAQRRGQALFTRRIGRLDLSCAGCHDDLWGRRLGAAVIPQAHPTGYPLYRLEWQATGSLQRRLRNCMTGVQAEPYPFGAPEYVDLEAYLMARARGLPLETPAVRP